MKNVIVLFSMLIVSQSVLALNNSTAIKIGTCKVDTLPAQQLITFLQQMDIPSFYGKPVDSFLLAVDAIPYDMKVYGGDHSQGALFRASYLWYRYSGGPVLRIYVREYTHMNRYSPTATWNVNLFRREKIYKIEVYKDQNTCINGACMQ